MRKLRTMSVIAMMSVSLSVEVEALPLDSAILAQSEMEKPALCETRKVVARDMYPDDPQNQSPLYVDDVDRQAQEGGTFLPSFMDYGSTVNPDLNGYSTYISSVCIDFAQRMAEGACAIERKWILPMNQYLIVKPKSAQLKARIFTMVGRYNETLVNWRFFEQAEPAMPRLFQVLEYQIACDGNGSATKIVVDKIP